jgi:hypothetical protein
VPATAALPIAVAFHDKNNPPTVPGYRESSGRGPVRPTTPAGPIKPDISTVGESTLAAYPTTMPQTTDTPYRNRSGTSIAAPIVAGTCALVFECRGKNLSSEDLKFLLKSSAHSGLAVNDSGAGYLQAADLCTFEMVKVGLALTPTLWDSESPGVFWRSPHYEFPPLRPIVDLDLGPGPILGPLPPSPEEFEITLRNVSGREIEGAGIEIFWAKPTTSLESEEIWFSTGILFAVPADAHGSTAAKLQSGNRIDLPGIAAGRRSKFRFAWDGSKIEWPGKLPGDRPCFLARVTDSKSAARTKRVGRTPLALDASCALHSVVSRSLHRSKPAEASFEVRVMGGDSLHVTSELVEGRVVLELPVRALPWRDMAWIEKNKSPMRSWDGKDDGHLPETPRPLTGQETRLVTDIRGAESLTIRGSVASVVLAEKVRGAGFVVPELRTAKGACPIAMRLRVEGGKISAKARAVHVLQMAKGRRVGGISLELHDPPEEGSA